MGFRRCVETFLAWEATMASWALSLVGDTEKSLLGFITLVQSPLIEAWFVGVMLRAERTNPKGNSRPWLWGKTGAVL